MIGEKELKGYMQNTLDKYDNLYNLDIDDINKNLNLILLDFWSIEEIPKFIVSRALYPMKNTNNMEKGKFIIRPSIDFKLNIDGIKDSFILFNNSSFYKEFIENIIAWILKYQTFLVYQYNLNRLNTEFKSILAESKCTFNIVFTIGEGVIDITDTEIILGVSKDFIEHLDNINLFSTNSYWASKYREKCVLTVKSCIRPYELLKIKSDFTEDFNIYTRKNIIKLLRKVVKRRIENVRIGEGYYESEHLFTLIEKRAVSANEIEDYDLDNVIVLDNVKPNMVEKKLNQTKIIVLYKLSPLEKKTGVLIEKPLKELLVEIERERGKF